MSRFRFTRLRDGQKVRTDKLGEVMGFTDAARERWLFVAPHDDDAVIGGGLWVDAAVQAGVQVDAIIVTDGRMGYCSAAQRLDIVPIRREETYESFAITGVPRQRVQYIGYPDAGLFDLQGRRVAKPGEPALEGHVGLQNAMTWHLRRVRPTRVFVPSPADLHPDHRITYQELMISIFHASGAVWPELGKRLDLLPTVYEMAVYCDFSGPPNLHLSADAGAFEKKLEAIAAYRSQEQIAQLVSNLRKAGPTEYLREVIFPLYMPEQYGPMFE